MRKSLSFWIVALAVFGTANIVHVSDARSETFWERYFGGSADEDEAKPKHVFLQPENGRSGTSKTDLNEVNKKLKEAEGKNLEAVGNADSAAVAAQAAKSKVMQVNVQRAQAASEKYAAAQVIVKKYEGIKEEDMTNDERKEFYDAERALVSAEANLQYYMNLIEDKSK